ncbi:MAG: hypothetical protein ACK4R9_11250 [Ignavibacterium sp.]
MKNTILFFAILVSISFFACSDYNSESSLITEPALQRPISGTPGQIYPYPFLFQFEKIKDVTYSRVESQGALEIYIKEDVSKFSHFYVTFDYAIDVPSSLFYLENKGSETLVLEDVNPNYIQNINVYGASVFDISREQILPYSDGFALNNLPIKGWKEEKADIHVYSNFLPYYVKWVYGEIDTKMGKFLVFLEKPKGEEFIIPEYNKYGVIDLKLYGYLSPLEKNFVSE